jgi:hypothetical protein
MTTEILVGRSIYRNNFVLSVTNACSHILVQCLMDQPLWERVRFIAISEADSDVINTDLLYFLFNMILVFLRLWETQTYLQRFFFFGKVVYTKSVAYCLVEWMYFTIKSCGISMIFMNLEMVRQICAKSPI